MTVHVLICITCANTEPYKAIIWPRKISFEYIPIIRQNLKPDKDFFQLYIFLETPKGVNSISVAPNGWEISAQTGLTDTATGPADWDMAETFEVSKEGACPQCAAKQRSFCDT